MFTVRNHLTKNYSKKLLGPSISLQQLQAKTKS